MKIILLILVFAIITGCSSGLEGSVQTTESGMELPDESIKTVSKNILPDLGIAPELETSVWLNSAGPLRISELKSKVVLLEMWTYGCINCRNVIPALKEWYSKYSSNGLVIIGNHYPEFDRERDLQNLKEAIESLGIEYPITQDNDGTTWRAYDNRFWPTLYLIDKTGHIRYTHIGEGKYDMTEKAIQKLLSE